MNLRSACLVLLASLPGCDGSVEPVPSFSVTVEATGTGSGIVTSSPGGLACSITAAVASGVCDGSFSGGATITVTALPATGHTFTGWSGDCSGTAACHLSMTRERKLTATFTAPIQPPTIGTQPMDLTVGIGQTASFSVVALGAAPFEYQWRKNGNDIPGATGATYSIPQTTNADHGAAFSVTVRNTAGTITSRAAVLTVTTTADLSSAYPGDVGISGDADVYFAENAEVASLTSLVARWGGSSAAGSVSIDPSTSPPGSPGSRSIRLTTTAGPLGPGTLRSAYLYHAFPGGLSGPVHVRWYVRYNNGGTFHHSGPRLGGNNPLGTTHSDSPAGVRPNGSDFFYVGFEPSGAKMAPATSSPMDYYAYWMHQRGTSFFPGLYYGNSFINDPAVAIDLSKWTCIEMRLTPNDPVTGFGGALELWIDGTKVSDVRQGTKGIWTEDNFKPDPAGAAFEGFQWRNTTDLPVNYLELLHFVDQDPTGFQNSVNYDHIVVARRYIGPMR